MKRSLGRQTPKKSPAKPKATYEELLAERERLREELARLQIQLMLQKRELGLDRPPEA